MTIENAEERAVARITDEWGGEPASEWPRPVRDASSRLPQLWAAWMGWCVLLTVIVVVATISRHPDELIPTLIEFGATVIGLSVLIFLAVLVIGGRR